MFEKKKSIYDLAAELSIITDSTRLRAFLSKHKKTLISLLTKRTLHLGLQSALFQFIQRPALLVEILKSLTDSERLEALTAPCDVEPDYSYTGRTIRLHDRLDPDRKHSLLHLLARSHPQALMLVLDTLKSDELKFNALMHRNNYGESVFYLFCKQHIEAADAFLKLFPASFSHTLLTTRSLDSVYYQRKLSNEDHHKITELPLFFFIAHPEKLAVILEHFSETELDEIMTIPVPENEKNLLEEAVKTPKSLRLLLNKLPAENRFMRFNNMNHSSLSELSDVETLSVLDEFFSKDQIREVLAQGVSNDAPNKHVLLNIYDQYQQQKDDNFQAGIDRCFQLIEAVLSYFESDAQKESLLNTETADNSTLLYHKALLINLELMSLVLNWIPKNTRLSAFCDIQRFSLFLKSALQNQLSTAELNALPSFSLATEGLNTPQLLSLMLNLLEKEERVKLTQHLISELTNLPTNIHPNSITILKHELLQELAPEEGHVMPNSFSFHLSWLKQSWFAPLNKPKSLSYQIRQAKTLSDLSDILRQEKGVAFETVDTNTP